MIQHPQHGKVITTRSYYEGDLASEKDEIEVSLFSTKDTILRDLIESIGVINSGETHQLDLCIMIDSKGRYRLIKKWGVK